MAEPDFETVPDSAFEELRVLVKENRRNPDFTLELKKLSAEMPAEPDAAREMLDEFVESLDLKGIGEAWIEVDRGTAERILVHVLTKSLAYGAVLMDPETASDIAERFFEAFGEKPRFFTNGDCVVGSVKSIDGKTVPGFSSISKCTLDTGIIAADSERIGILWAWDED